MTDLNPHLKQMSDESMVRNLDAQARAIWPQEAPLFRRYDLAPDIHILDAGCGTGEGARRLAELFPRARVLAVDILDHHLALARERHGGLAPRLTFENQSIFGLRSEPERFGRATGTDLFIGRNTYSILSRLGLEDITVDYVVVDPLRVPRETFAQILEAWRDGYAESIGELTERSRDEAIACFDQMIADARHPQRYAVWMVPVVSAMTPSPA